MIRAKQLLWFIVPAIIVLLSGLLRLPALGTLPDGFFTDEAALGYNGWSIMQTGRDEWGEFLPLTLRSFHDDKPAIYAYLTIPFIAVLGLTEEAARMPAAVFGTILPVFVYLWLLSTLRSRKGSGDVAPFAVALVTALVLVFTPWHWEVSRTAIEAGVALSFTMLILVLLRLKSRWSLAAAILLSVITLYTYHSARLLLPPILFFGAMFDQLSFKKVVIGFSIVLFGFGMFLSSTGSSERFYQISIFNDRELLALRDEAIREDGGVTVTPLLTSRLTHNKPVSLIFGFIDNYVKNSSLEFLFIGGAQPTRAAIPETGQFLLFLLPFFIIGLLWMAKRLPQDKFQLWMLVWMLIAPIPASFTYPELPHVYRNLFMLIPVSVLIGHGLVVSLQWVRAAVSLLPLSAFILQKIATILAIGFVVIVAVALGWNSFKAWHEYATHQQIHQPWHRTGGYERMVAYLNTLPSQANRRIVITRSHMEPYIFILFYNKIDPKLYQALEQKRLSRHELDVEHVREWTMFEYTFSVEKCPHDPRMGINMSNVYLVSLGCDVPVGYSRIGSIDFADGVPMFHIDIPVPLAAEASAADLLQ